MGKINFWPLSGAWIAAGLGGIAHYENEVAVMAMRCPEELERRIKRAPTSVIVMSPQVYLIWQYRRAQ